MAEIVVHNLGKKYKHYSNRWERLAEWITGGRRCLHSARWALRDISFYVSSGESVGIIGQNGAGKSTLLKILTGTTRQTEGNIEIGGRVSALLELGMGFNEHFSGRENAVLACQMTGIRREEINTRLSEIEKFSELADYFDQPLRVYSTGMRMRLAFSAATVVRPDILIVDEALAVGDSYFQHKCIRRIRAFKQEGTTLLFVSHDPGAVKSLCERAILLDRGRLAMDASPDTVLDYYNGMIARKSADEEIQQIETITGRTATRSGSGAARILKVEMVDDRGRAARAFRVGDCVKICCHVDFYADIDRPTIGILIRDRLGNDAFGTNTFHLDTEPNTYHSGEHMVATFSLQLNLGYGNYSLSVALHSGDTHLDDCWDWWDQCLAFQVIPGNTFRFVGLASLPVKAEIQRSALDDRNQKS